MRNRVSGPWVMLLASMLLAACGGGDGGGPPGPPDMTAISGDSKLMTLTPSQAAQVCDDVEDYQTFNISPRDVCKLSGVASALLLAMIDPTFTDVELRDACALGVDQCIAYPTDPTGKCPLGVPSTCTPTPTVNDLLKCVRDDVAAANAALAAVPACTAVTRTWLLANGANAGQFDTPASCVALAAECPDILAR